MVANAHELAFFFQKDPELAMLMEKCINSGSILKIPKKAPKEKYASRLYSSIISQQISVKAADAIERRFVALVKEPNDAITIQNTTVEEFRQIGLSRQKATYIKSIAEQTSNGSVKLDHLDELNDEAVIAELCQLKGVGRWTAEMFLLFTLGRPDVFSAGDLGLINALRKLRHNPTLTKDDALLQSSKWSPYRSTACLYLWHSLDNNPIR